MQQLRLLPGFCFECYINESKRSKSDQDRCCRRRDMGGAARHIFKLLAEIIDSFCCLHPCLAEIIDSFCCIHPCRDNMLYSLLYSLYNFVYGVEKFVYVVRFRAARILFFSFWNEFQNINKYNTANDA